MNVARLNEWHALLRWLLRMRSSTTRTMQG